MAQYSIKSLTSEYRRLWSEMKVVKTAEATKQAKTIIKNKARYKGIEKSTGVPWFVIGCLHWRESGGNFNTYLGNGQPLNIRTTIVPKGRGPFPSFEAGAYDALVTVEHLDLIKIWGPEHIAYAAEKFNGFGYRSPSKNIPSPYLWGGSSVQKRGKYIRDGVFDHTVMDPQIGVMTVLNLVMLLDSEASFTTGTAQVKEEKQAAQPASKPTSVPNVPSPKAEDTSADITPMVKSQTNWGTVLNFLGGTGATILAALQGIPWYGWVVLGLLIAGGAFLAFKGRWDTQKLLVHLTPEPDVPVEPAP